MARSENGHSSEKRLPLEAALWQSADALRGKVDAASYKHVVLGLVFLRAISEKLRTSVDTVARADRSARSRKAICRELGVLWVPPASRWEHLQERSRDDNVAGLIDNAMREVERANPTLRGALFSGYESLGIDARALGDLVALLGDADIPAGSGQGVDMLGVVYEYFLGQFARSEGKNAGMKEGRMNVERDRARHVNIATLATKRFIAEHDGAPGILMTETLNYMDLADRMVRRAKASRGLIDFHLAESYGPNVDSLSYYVANMKRLAVGLGELGLHDGVVEADGRIAAAVAELSGPDGEPIIEKPGRVKRALLARTVGTGY